MSVNNEFIAADSLLLEFADSSRIADSLTTSSQTDLNAIVYATAADSLSFDVKNKTMHLYGDGNIKYKTI